MERYQIKRGVPVAPPEHGVTKDGRVISNFAERVKHDAVFAAENGYYPIEEAAVDAEPLEEAIVTAPTFTFAGDRWIRHVRFLPIR